MPARGQKRKVVDVVSVSALWEHGDAKQWQEAHELYEKTLKSHLNTKKRDLSDLMEYIDTIAPEKISSTGGLTGVEDLVSVLEYKLARGTWRPLMRYVQANSNKQVINSTMVAFKGMSPHSASASDIKTRLNALAVDKSTKLKGVGPAMGLGLLSLCCSAVPWMSDEALLVAKQTRPDGSGKPLYTIAAALNLARVMQAKARELGNGWSARKVEQAIFAAIHSQ